MSAAPPGVPTIDVTEASARLAAGGDPPPLVVDVREADEFAAARLDGAALVPLSTFGVRFEELPKDRPLLVICASGRRSLAAAAHLLRNGWTDVVNVEGGIIAWQRAGLPVRQGPVAPGEGDLPG